MVSPRVFRRKACRRGPVGLLYGRAPTGGHTKEGQAPPEVAIDAEINLNHDGSSGFFLTARLDVSLPGLDREVAEELIHAAHGICPYSKATHGNIAAETNLV